MPVVRFDFAKTGLPVTLPDGPIYDLLESRSASPIANLAAALGQALDHPIAGLPLSRLAAGKNSAAISVCDITRPAPNATTLPPILRRLHAAGIPVEGITILIATGLHRPATADEIETIVGLEIARTYRIVNHDARAAHQHRWLGSTAQGTPVAIDERFMAADLHLSLGFIEQHLMLGFSGGRKLVAPGLADEQTIKTIHSPRFMREPNATEGCTEENPLHAELLEISRMARHDFILDVTLTQHREISGIFAGSPAQAHAGGVAFLRQTSLEPLTALADVVITSAAGYPLDLTFYQTIKGVTAAQHLVKPGGRILILAACTEGVGSPEFTGKMATFSGHRSYLDEIADTPVIADQWQLEKLALVGLKNDLFFYTPGVTGKQLGALAAKTFATAEEAIVAVLADLPRNPRVALVPEGPYVFARLPEPAIPASR